MSSYIIYTTLLNYCYIIKMFMTSLLIIGLGTLGNAVLPLLRFQGIDRVYLMDGDIVEEKNIANQPLFLRSDIGKNKARVIADRLNKALNIFSPIQSYLFSSSQLEEINPEYIIDCTDSVSSKEIVNNYLTSSNKIGVIASISEKKGFALRPSSQGLCYNCIMQNTQIVRRECTSSNISLAFKLAKEIQPLFFSDYNFVEVTIDKVNRLKLNKAKNCSIINAEFYQICGNTIKLLKPIDLSNLDLKKFKDLGDFYKFSSGKKEVIITKEGFVMGHNVTKEELNNIINHNNL